MATCANCIHHSLCDYNTNISGNGKVRLVYSEGADVKCSFFQNTADVAPKSEVERLREELTKAEADVRNYMKVAEYQQSLSVKRYHEINRLKEDIERLQDINEHDVENLRLAKQEVARVIFEEIQTALEYEYMYYLRAYDYTLQTKIDELKKKYTEGESNG